MNMNLKLELNMQTLKAALGILQKGQAYVYGICLIGIFAFTAYQVNLALNVQPAAKQTAIKDLPKVTFDAKTMSSLKQLNAVTGEVPIGNLGANDPFK